MCLAYWHFFLPILTCIVRSQHCLNKFVAYFSPSTLEMCANPKNAHTPGAKKSENLGGGGEGRLLQASPLLLIWPKPSVGPILKATTATPHNVLKSIHKKC